MKNTVSKFDLNAAFKALDEIEIPVAKEGKCKPNRINLHEMFSAGNKTDRLVEDYYDVNDNNDVDQAATDREDEIAAAKLKRIEKIVDLDAKSPDDLLPSYAGKIIIECPQCMTKLYKNEEDIEKDPDDPTLCNINEPCQVCGNISGYTIVGKVAPVDEEEMSEFTGEEQPAEGEENVEGGDLDLDFEEPESEEGEETPTEENTEAAAPEENEEDLDLDLDLEEPEEEEEEEEKHESLNKSQFLKNAEKDVLKSKEDSENLTLNEAVKNADLQAKNNELNAAARLLSDKLGKGITIATGTKNGKDYIIFVGNQESKKLLDSNVNKACKEIGCTFVKNNTTEEGNYYGVSGTLNGIEQIFVKESINEAVIGDDLEDDDISEAFVGDEQIDDKLAEAYNQATYAAYKTALDDVAKYRIPLVKKQTNAGTTETVPDFDAVPANNREAAKKSYDTYKAALNKLNGELNRKEESLSESVELTEAVNYIQNASAMSSVDVDTFNRMFSNFPVIQNNVLMHASQSFMVAVQVSDDFKLNESCAEDLTEAENENQDNIDKDDLEFNGSDTNIKVDTADEKIASYFKNGGVNIVDNVIHAVNKKLGKDYSDYYYLIFKKQDAFKRAVAQLNDICKAVSYLHNTQISGGLIFMCKDNKPVGKLIYAIAPNDITDGGENNIVVNNMLEIWKQYAKTYDDRVKQGSADKPAEPKTAAPGIRAQLLTSLSGSDIQKEAEKNSELKTDIESENNTLNENLTEDEDITKGKEPTDDLSNAEFKELMDNPAFDQPVSDAETQEIIADGSFDTNDLEDVDEESFEENVEESLKAVYENVNSFTLTNCEVKPSGNLVFEGLIVFKSGNTRPTTYEFTRAKKLSENKIQMTGVNNMMTNSRFIMEGLVENNKLSINNLSYSYNINTNLVEGITKKN